MNPDICTVCERSFRRVKKHQHISETVTILFADMRGYTQLAARTDAPQLADFLAFFQDQCAQAVWTHDGIVNKVMGDGLMALFNFPIKIENHAEAAVNAALDMQQRWKTSLAPSAAKLDPGGRAAALGLGVGVHTGRVEIGEFSTAHSDFTAIGGPVNLASRLESQAAASEILVSSETAMLVPAMAAGAMRRTLVLKGIDTPVEACVLA
jgi:adenylate cyclase